MANIICFKQEKGSQKLLKFIVKGHGYTLKTSIFAIFQKSDKKRGDTVRCAPLYCMYRVSLNYIVSDHY